MVTRIQLVMLLCVTQLSAMEEVAIKSHADGSLSIMQEEEHCFYFSPSNDDDESELGECICTENGMTFPPLQPRKIWVEESDGPEERPLSKNETLYLRKTNFVPVDKTEVFAQLIENHFHSATVTLDDIKKRLEENPREDVTVTAFSGNTLLHVAARLSMIELKSNGQVKHGQRIIQQLLDRGASKTKKNGRCLTPYQCAVELVGKGQTYEKYKQILDLLFQQES